MSEKPHYGRIKDWAIWSVGSSHVIVGRALDHPRFAMTTIRTSRVLSHDKATGEIETRNSRYTLVGDPAA